MLKTDYKDYIPASGAGTLRKYQRIDNGDGTVSFQDVTEYAQTGDKNQAGVINTTNAAVNEINTSKGEAGGYASLDEYGHIPKEQLNMPEPTYSGKLVVHVTRYDGGEIGTTKVRVQNTALGMDLSYTPDALGKVTLHLVGNKTYSISLVNVPDPYYGEAATQYIGFDTENELALQVKDQPDIIGFQINLSTGAVDYTDGAANWTPMSMNGSTLEPGSFENSWLVKDVRPCLLKNGVVQYYLKKIDGFMMFDYTLKENGDPSDITTGNDGDVMIEIPKVYVRVTVEIVLNVKYLHIRFTKQPLSGYDATIIFGSPARDSIYYAAYKPWMASNSGSPVSISGQVPVKFRATSWQSSSSAGQVNSLQQAITQVKKYSGISDIDTRDIVFLYELYIMLFKSHNLTAYGYSAVTSSTYAHNTGAYNNHPLCYMAVDQFRFLGIEDPFSQITPLSYGFENSFAGYAPGNDEMDLQLANRVSAIGGAAWFSDQYFYLSEEFAAAGSVIDTSTNGMSHGASAPGDNDFAIVFYPNNSFVQNCEMNCLLTVDVHSSTGHHLQFDGKTANYMDISFLSEGSPSQYINYPIDLYLAFKFLEPIS